MNNKPVRRMEGVCVVGNVGITLFSGGQNQLGRRARGRVEEFHCTQQQCAGTVCILFTVTEELMFVLLRTAQSSPTGDSHSKSIQGWTSITQSMGVKAREVKGHAQGHGKAVEDTLPHPILCFLIPGLCTLPLVLSPAAEPLARFH